MEDKQKISAESAAHWERVYKDNSLNDLPWEEGAPSAQLVKLIASGLVEKGPALDICTGSGNNAIYLAQRGFTCFGLDISKTAINHAKEKSAKAGVTCEFIVTDVLNLPYPDDTFNLVFDRGCFHSVSPSQRPTFIEGVRRVLKVNGKYQLNCFSDKSGRWTGPPYSFSPKDIRMLFSPLFKIRYIKEISNDSNGFREAFLAVLMEKPSTLQHASP